MKALGRGSLASALKIVLDVAWYLSWAGLVLASLFLVAAGAAFIMNFLGYQPGVLSETLKALRDFRLFFPLLVAEIVALMIVVDRLRRIFGTLVAGNPFVPENAGHLQVIAIAIAAYQILRHVFQGSVAMLLTLVDQPIGGGVELDVAPDINLGGWFAVIALLVFAEVFREGARMRQEQKYTI